jgi:hypothetical protein
MQDKDLLQLYKLGFNDELRGLYRTLVLNGLALKAYNLGRSDALVGDDVMSHNYQSDFKILKRIKK